MDATQLLQLFIFGKGIQKFKLLTACYLLLMCFWGTNFIMNCLGYYYTGSEIDMEAIANFITNPISIAVLITVSLCYMLLFIWIDFMLFVLSFITPFLIDVIGVLFGLFFCIWYRQYKMIGWVFGLRLSKLAPMAKMVLAPIISADNRYYKWTKKIIQDVYHEEDGTSNMITMTAIFISTNVVYKIYHLNDILPATVGTILTCLMCYFIINTMILIYVYRKKNPLMDFLIEIENSRNKPQSNNEPN